MAGWSREKRLAVEKAFYQYLGRCFVNSKDAGRICLGQHLYEGQRRVITQIFDALEADKRKIYILKSRQLGISTIIRALTVFLLGIHKGLKGAIVFDTDQNKTQARTELAVMIKDLPKSLKFPAIKGDNRVGLSLSNDSEVLFMSAGVRKSKTSGTLGRSVGLTIAHCSELCSWDNDDGLEAFEQSLSEVHPDRLYIYESTARGFNKWHTMCQDAQDDPHHCVFIFLGWWSKDSQRIERGTIDFQLYGEDPPSAEEQEKIAKVKELYGHEITPEQLAWVRRKYDPAATSENPDAKNDEADPTRIQEQPWTADEAFQQTGSTFFPAKQLTDQTQKFVSDKYRCYMYMAGNEFVDMKVYDATNAKMTDLKVWEEPDNDGVYIIACDPAYGENENNDRSSIQVLRCYSDGIDQVAEYASPLINTRQLAWVIASLLGWYGAGRAEARYILELNGPGTAVFNELKGLRFQIENSYFDKIEEKGLKDVFRNVKTYIFQRPDGMNGGTGAYHFKCLHVDEPLPTPRGWTTMGQLQTGDELFDEKGQVCRVSFCSPVMEDHDCYEIFFEDGSSIVADADHLWPVARAGKKGSKSELVRTIDLIPCAHSIACTKPIDLPEKELPIDPYVLGAWLGDGHSATGLITGAKADLTELLERIRDRGFSTSEMRVDKRNGVCRCKIIGLSKLLSKHRLLRNKHIPKAYLRASKEQRLALLQGLMDTDGSIDKARQCGFNSTIPRLAESFKELLSSLGIKPKFFVKQPFLMYKGKQAKCKPCYQFWFTAYEDLPVFRLDRKLSRQKNPVFVGGLGGKGGMRPNRSRRNKVVGVRQVPSVPVRCIQVGSESHLYLAGKGMIPTHNTNVSLKVMIMERLRDFISNGTLRVRSMAAVAEMKTIARDGDSISAPQSMRDDCVLALAFGTHYWETHVRKGLITQKRSRDAEAARKRFSIVDQVQLFQQNHLSQFFEQKKKVRVQQAQLAARNGWRTGGRRY